MGTQLLRRTTRQMVATDEGERFLATARDLVSAMHETDTMFRQNNSQLHGRLRVDMPSRIGRRIVIPALPSLLENHPRLSIEISTSDSMVDLIAEGLDCVLRAGDLKDSEIICQKLGDVDIITCASPAYLTRYGLPKSTDDLSGHVMVNYGQSLPTRPASFVHRTLSQFAEVPMSNTVTVNNAEAYIAAAKAGLGMIQIPAFDVMSAVEAGDLVPVLERLRPPPMQLSLLYARRRNVPARISVFQAWVHDALREKRVFDRFEIKA